MNKHRKIWSSLALELSKRDVKLAPFIEQIGPPHFELRSEPYEALARSILSQQLATAAARTIILRFCELSPPFPSPEFVLKCRTPTLRKVGVSGRKALYLKDLAHFWRNATWRSGWEKLSDEELTNRLVEVKGIGEWTAHMFLIFSLGRPDILPTLDYGVRRGIALIHNLPTLPHPKELPGLVPHWKGAYSVAAWYLWKALDKKLLVETVPKTKR